MKKRLLSLLLAFVMLFSLLPVTALAAEVAVEFTVTEESSGAPISGASVTISRRNTNVSGTTDDSGKVTLPAFDKEDDRTYTITVTKDGYETYRSQVSGQNISETMSVALSVPVENVTVYLNGYAVHDENQSVVVTIGDDTYTYGHDDLSYRSYYGYYVTIENVVAPSGKTVTAAIVDSTGKTLVQDTSTIGGSYGYSATVQLAIWSYTITFDANGGTLTGVDTQITESGITETAKVVDIKNYVPTHEDSNYQFAGWKVSGSDHVYTQSYTVSEPSYGTEVSVTLVAQWQWTGDWIYELVYHANTTDTVTGMPETNPVKQNTATFTLPTTNPTRAGYEFLGWSTVSNNDYYIISGSSITLNTDGVYNTNKVSETLYAMWDEINTTSYNWYVADLTDTGSGFNIATASGNNSVSNVTVTVSSDGTNWETLNNSTATTARYIKFVPADGFYIQHIVVACNDGDHGFRCSSVGNGKAYTESFDPTSGAITLDSSKGDFSHESPYNSYYHVLIELAEMPSPVYVVYEAGEAVAAFNDTKPVVANSGAYATNSAGSVAFKYDQKGPTHTVLDPSTRVVTVTEGNTTYEYTFTGWELEYFSDVSNETTFPDPNGSLADTYGVSTVTAGSSITLYTYAKLTAKWVKSTFVAQPGLTVVKTVDSVNGNYYTAGTSVAVNDVVVWKITVNNTGNTELTQIQVTDTLVGNVLYSDRTCTTSSDGTIASLAVGGSASVYAKYTVTAADENSTIKNVAVATVTDGPTGSDTSEVPVKDRYTLTVEFYLEEISDANKFTDSTQAYTTPTTPATMNAGDGYAIWVLQNGNQSGYTNFKAPANLNINDVNYVFDPVATTDLQHGHISGDTTVRLVYSVDEIGGGDGKDDPDNIPDKYQATVLYKSANTAYGTVSPTKEVLTIYADAAKTVYAQTGNVAIGGSTATANTNYVFKHWVDYEHKEMLNQDETLENYTIVGATGGSTYTFTAHWDTDPNSYHNIVYHYGTGYTHIAGVDMPVDEEKYQNGTTVTESMLKPLPTASSYVFDGWFEDAACTVRFDGATIQDHNLILYAKYFTMADLFVTKTVEYIGGEAYTNGMTAELGDEIIWTIAVENTGQLGTSIPLPIDVLKDSDGNTIDNLTVVLGHIDAPAVFSINSQADAEYQVPGESTIYFTARYTVTEEDLGKTLVNIVTVSGENPVPAPGVEVEAEKPGLSVTKQVATVGGEAADYTDPNNPVIPAANEGETIVWNIIVENTGNTTLTNIKVADSLATVADKVIDTIVSLAPGAKETVTFSYTVTDADVTAHKVNNVATATDGTTTDTDDSEEVKVNNPGLKVDKSVVSVDGKDLTRDTVAEVGDIIIYRILVKNDGNTKLENITITDALVGNSLFTDIECAKPFENIGFALNEKGTAGDSLTLYATYTVEDTDAGKTVINVAVAKSGETESEDPSEHVPVNATLTVEYYLEDGNGRKLHGTPATYTLPAGTSWNVVVDDEFTGTSTHKAPENISITTGEGTEAVTTNYAFDPLVSDKVLSGVISGNVTVKLVYALDEDGGTEPHGGDEDPDKYQVTIKYVAADGGLIDTEATGGKTEEVLTIYAADGVTYAQSGTICATGSVAKAADGYIFDKWTIRYNSDPEYDTTFTADCTGGQIGARVANGGDEFVFTAYFKAKNTDVDVRKNVSKINDADYAVGMTAKVGDTITWSITVTNKGNVAQTLKLTDTLSSGTSIAIKDASGGTVTSVTLAPHQTVTYTATYTTMLADAGKTLVNTAVAKDGDKENKGDSPGVEVGPALDVTKSVNKTSANVGDTLTYTITVTNTANVELTGLVMKDEKLGKTENISSLGIGETKTFTYTYVVQASDVGKKLVNTAVVAKDGEELDKDNSEVTNIINPYIPPVIINPDPPKLNKEDHFAYIIGKDDGLVHPLDPITRAETATIFFRMLLEGSRQAYWTQENNYVDVEINHWFNNAASTLSNAGIITGRPGGYFAPYANITRAEFATLAVRFFLNEDVEINENNLTDVKGHWAEANINLAYALGLITGYPDASFRPDQEITRAEAMVIVNRVLERHPDKDHLLDYMITWPDNMNPNVWYYADVQEATNSHLYVMMTDKNGQKYEIWQQLLPVRDWAALEKEWSNYNSSHNPGEVVDVALSN